MQKDLKTRDSKSSSRARVIIYFFFFSSLLFDASSSLESQPFSQPLGEISNVSRTL